MWISRFASSPRAVLAVIVASWLVCASQPANSERQQPQSNWTSPDAPCANFDNLRNPVRRDIGVKIDAAGPWADGFRRALRFWNTVLTANLHEEPDLSVCSIRIIDGNPGMFDQAVAARSQMTDWAKFRGKIAVSSVAAKGMNSAEIYAAAVHEIGHMLGLKHNANVHSVMYFLDVEGSEVLDSRDISDLSRRHELRPVILAADFVPIQESSGK